MDKDDFIAAALRNPINEMIADRPKASIVS
jgi:hypothetical protein